VDVQGNPDLVGSQYAVRLRGISLSVKVEFDCQTHNIVTLLYD